MRLAKGIAAAVCFLVGLWLTLRAAGQLTAVLHAVPRWWPALPAAIGAAILVRSRRPGPQTAVALVLIAASCLAFAIAHHAITRVAWPFAAGAGLMAAGLALAYLTARGRSSSVTNQTQRIVVAFRSTKISPSGAGLLRIRVYIFCGRLELDLTQCLPPGRRPDYPLMIEITACLADVAVIAHPKTTHYHEAFVMLFGLPVRGKAFSDTANKSAPAVVASLAFFSRITGPW
jgi:hypothetical protein